MQTGDGKKRYYYAGGRKGMERYDRCGVLGKGVGFCVVLR